MPSLHITLSGGLLTHQFIEAVQQPAFNHPAAAPETFALPGRKAPTPAELERTIGAAWELLVERWDGLERDLPAMDISTLRERWIRPLFSLLDFNLEYQRADLVLQDDLRFPISHLGLPLGTDLLRVPVHSVLPGDGGLDARREAGSGLRRLAPHDLLQRYLNMNREARWGLLCDGLRLRLLRDYHHTYTRGYVEFDLQGIFSSRDYAAFRALYRLCHASRFIPMAAPTAASTPAEASRKRGKAAAEPVVKEEEEAPTEEAIAETPTPLESFYQHALATGVKVGEDLRKNVRQAIETFANGFLQATPGLPARLQSGEIGVGAFYDDILHTIYRMLFLLFAEQRGMFPGRGSLYMDEYSLTALRALAERPAGEDPHVDLWERLKAAFRMVEHGAPALGVYGYNGALFAMHKTPLLTPPDDPGDGAPALRNDALLRAVRALTTIERDGVLQRISYADLSVEEMGSVYESLLDYTPRIAAAAETVENRALAAGTFFLDPRGKERKTTGSYYTHPSLVNELIQSALLPVLEERLEAAVPGFDPDHPERLSPEQRQAAEAALLSIKVIDPAAGSGAFLIAADNLLGLRLAQIRGGDLYPSERLVRRARRDVLAHCIYAVDLNPMAVELCKVSLWINAVVEDQPLNFLDHHIKCGNSLVGIGPGLPVRLEAETSLDLSALTIPSKAYDALSMDEVAIASAARERNRCELEQRKRGARQRSIWQVTAVYGSEAPSISEITELGPVDPGEAERRYHNWAEAELHRLSRFAADVWTAAFFWPWTAELANRLEPPTEARLRLACDEGPGAFEAEFVAQVERLRHEHRFFHWPLEFPEVFGRQGAAGFDVVLGNPPWERIKLQEKEFFSLHAPEIAEAPNAAARRRLIAALAQNNPGLWDLYRQALRHSEATARFLRASGRFPLASGGDINTYSVFAEHDRNLVAPGGRAGIIVPSGIATDYTNKEFFADLVENNQLASLYDFENRKGIFPGVHRSYKFCLLTLRNPSDQPGEPGPDEKPAEFAFFLHTTDDLTDPQRRFHLTAADFARLNPNTRTCPVFRSRTDADLTRKLYRAAPVLVNEATGENPWGVSFATMFHMTNDSGLFRTREQLEAEGFRLFGNRFVQGEDEWLPLYEAKMFWHFDHRYGSYEKHPSRGDTQLPSPSEKDYLDPNYFSLPWYWVNKADVLKRFQYDRDWAFAFRDITNSTNERTAIFCIMPAAGFGNNAPLLIPHAISARDSAFLVANLSNFPFDFVTRKKVGGTHLNFFIAKQLPIIAVKTYSQLLQELFIPVVMELIVTSWDIQGFADELWMEANDSLRMLILRKWDENAAATKGGHLNAVRPDWTEPANHEGFPRPPFKWDEERRSHLRAELDGLYAHLYGLARDEFAYILDTFPIVRRKDEARYGEYRTKRLCLEAYDRLVGSDLIPAEARAMQQESVLQQPASFPALKLAPVREAQPAKAVPPQPEAKPAAAPAAQPADKASPAKPEPAKASPTEASPAKSTSAGGQLPLMDYGLYQCKVCGKMVLGFDREEHTRDVHQGKDPGYRKHQS
jgi:type I restriction-modification system DNA methylase subunit